MTSILCNPLATVDQLTSSLSQTDGIPVDLEISLRWAGSHLIQGAGIMLRLPQKTVATAVVLFQRFYLLSSMRSHAIIDACHASIFLSSKLTENPTRARDIINVTAYLLNVPTTLPVSPPPARRRPDEEDGGSPAPPPEKYHVSEQSYFDQRSRFLAVEMEILKACGFQTHLSLPYTLVINYIQTLSALSPEIVKRAFGYLNDALLSPRLLYLTHQPNALAVAAVYLGARDCGVKLPLGWWDIFDCEWEELRFLAVGMKAVEEFVKDQIALWKGKTPGIPWDLEELEMYLERRRILESEMEG